MSCYFRNTVISQTKKSKCSIVAIVHLCLVMSFGGCTISPIRLPSVRRYAAGALEVYPKFLVAATDLAAILIDKGEPDSELLLPYLEMPELPDETRLNQVVAWLSAGRYAQADSLAFDLPDTGIYHKAKVYAAALNGRYNEVMQEISAESPFNEVLMLLAIKSNEQAWEKAKLLGNSAKEEYIKAVAANRVDEVVLALSYLESAFKKDPSLRDVASVDGDVLDLLQQED